MVVGSNGENYRLLLVDDDDAVVAALTASLQYLEVDVHVATSGNDALEKLRAGDYAVLLTDHRMPGMTGEQLIAEARTHLERAGTQVFIMSGWYDTTGTGVRHQVGGYPVRMLSKPMGHDVLEQIVQVTRA